MPEEHVLTEDPLEDNLLKVFCPVHFWQKILASARVRIKNKVVTYLTAWQTVYSIIWLFSSISSSYSFQKYYYDTFYGKDTIMYLICIFGALSANISYSFNLINMYTQRYKNVNIYAMLQKVDRIMQLDKYTYYTDFHYRLNCLTIFLVLAGFISGFTAHAYSLLEHPIYVVLYGLGVLTIYMDLIVGGIMLYFLLVRMMVFNRVIKERIKQYKGNRFDRPKAITLKRRILFLVKPTVKANSLMLTDEKWLECLQDILRCYRTINELYSLPILNLSLTVLIWTFLVIGAMIIGYRSGVYPLSATLTLGLWAVSYYVVLTMAAIVNDWFIMKVQKMKLLCIRLIVCDYDGPYQKTASEMIRIIRYDPPIFYVYGMFVLERKLPLEIIGVIAANVIVVIQFLID